MDTGRTAVRRERLAGDRRLRVPLVVDERRHAAPCPRAVGCRRSGPAARASWRAFATASRVGSLPRCSARRRRIVSANGVDSVRSARCSADPSSASPEEIRHMPIIVTRSSKPSGSRSTSSSLRHGWQWASTTGASVRSIGRIRTSSGSAETSVASSRPRRALGLGAPHGDDPASWRYSPMASRSAAEPARASAASVSVSGKRGGGASAPRRTARPGLLDGRRQLEPALETVEPGRDQGAQRQVRVGRAVDRLPLDVRAAAGAETAGALEPQRRLAVLVAPADVGARPVAGDEPHVGERRGRADRRECREVLERAGDERGPGRAQALGPGLRPRAGSRRPARR